MTIALTEIVGPAPGAAVTGATSVMVPPGPYAVNVRIGAAQKLTRGARRGTMVPETRTCAAGRRCPARGRVESGHRGVLAVPGRDVVRRVVETGLSEAEPAGFEAASGVVPRQSEVQNL
ncbi:hypothetical protein ABN034_17560 [Actinopolymorpha sp. B11F2]|uniref:hypothetical protein n=1 Tax=Actinopolymorpha sp. B11F2 TaxID=3160862 RepID=UPI0032E4568C